MFRREATRTGQRRGYWRFVLWPLGLAVALFAGFYWWQPWEVQLFPRAVPGGTRWTEPEPERLFAAGTRVVVVTAHPDDSEFYIGGLLTRLSESEAELFLIVCTDGDKAYYPFEDAKKNRIVRQGEQRAAAAKWHAQEVVFLGFPDGRLRVTEALVRSVQRELQRIQPAYIFTFDADYPPRIAHQDHRLAGHATEIAAAREGFDGWLCRFSTAAPNFALDVTDVWPRKMELVAVHKSQFYGDRLERIRNLIGNRDSSAGEFIGVGKAEALRVSRLKPPATR